jgi:hypothetical protein
VAGSVVVSMFLWLNQLAQAVKLYNQMRHVDHESQWRHYGSIKLTSTRAKGVPWRSILITSNNPFQFSTIVTCAIETVRSKCGCRDPSEFFFTCMRRCLQQTVKIDGKGQLPVHIRGFRNEFLHFLSLALTPFTHA